MYEVTKAFKASENGSVVESYKPGKYKQLPPVALKYAKANGLVEVLEPEGKEKESGQKVENKTPEISNKESKGAKQTK